MSKVTIVQGSGFCVQEFGTIIVVRPEPTQNSEPEPERQTRHTMSERNILANQKSILKNQAAILANQKKLLANQGKLDALLKGQTAIKANQAKIIANQGRILRKK